MLDAASLDDDWGDVAAALGSPLAAAEPVGWGDARATFRLTLANGSKYAVRRLPGHHDTLARRIASTAAVFADAGLPAPRATVIQATAATWLSVPWIDGTTGAAWLDDPDRARHLADRMGELVRHFDRIDPAGLPIEPGAPGDAGATAIADRLASLALEPRVRRAVESAMSGGYRAGSGPPRVVHGDFAPINVIVGADGEIAALLDFEHAHAGDPHTDVAWWGWVVRHHHPEAWAAAWPTFRAAAGVEAGVTDAALHDVALLELARRAESAADEEARRRWVERLTDAASWTIAPDGQLT